MQDDRYQYQCFCVRAYRWLRYKPWYALRASVRIVGWFIQGAKIPSDEIGWHKGRWGYAKFIFGLYLSLADCDMNHLYTMEEVFNTQDLW